MPSVFSYYLTISPECDEAKRADSKTISISFFLSSLLRLQHKENCSTNIFGIETAKQHWAGPVFEAVCGMGISLRQARDSPHKKSMLRIKGVHQQLSSSLWARYAALGKWRLHWSTARHLTPTPKRRLHRHSTRHLTSTSKRRLHGHTRHLTSTA